jgi:hypothetical protein
MPPPAPISQAFGEGLHREQRLIAERKDWSMVEWWERKLFLDEMIEAEEDRVERARLQGRLMAVCVHGQLHFGSAKVLEP